MESTERLNGMKKAQERRIRSLCLTLRRGVGLAASTEIYVTGSLGPQAFGLELELTSWALPGLQLLDGRSWD